MEQCTIWSGARYGAVHDMEQCTQKPLANICCYAVVFDIAHSLCILGGEGDVGRSWVLFQRTETLGSCKKGKYSLHFITLH